MLPDAKKLKHWMDHFYGYGSWEAPLWFVAHEEGGGEYPEEVAEKVNYFKKVHPAGEDILCDIREIYRNVLLRSEAPKAKQYLNRYEYRFGENAVQNNVWKDLTAFAHGYLNRKPPDFLTYQKNIFSSATDKREALIQLYPLPSPHNHAWYYQWIELPGLEFIRNRTTYQEMLYPIRIKTLLSNIRRYQPEVVLMYGMENINVLKKSVVEFFDGAKFNSVKGTKLVIPQHHRADVGKTTLVITTQIPALRHGRVETGFDWEEFGKSLKHKA